MLNLETSHRPEPARFNPMAALLAVGGQLVLLGLLVAMAPSAPALKPASAPTLQVVYVSPELFSGVLMSPGSAAVPVGVSSPLPPEGAAVTAPAVAPAVPSVAAPAVSAPVATSQPATTTAPPRPVASLPSPRSAPVEPAPVAVSAPRAVPIAEPEPARPAPVAAPVVSTPPPTPEPPPAVVAQREPERPAASGGESRPPRPIRSVMPAYPSMARSQRIVGTVTVEVTVGTDGSVEEANVLQSPSPLLNSAALDAAKKMKFEPALANGSPIRAKTVIPFSFGLKK